MFGLRKTQAVQSDESLRSLIARKHARRDFYQFPWSAPRTVLDWVYRPTVSVILPVYNHSRYLKEAVSSVLSQEGVRLELIVVDDGSDDSPKAALSHFLDDPRLRFHEEPHRGLAATLNRGFELAVGNFLTWISADNRLLPGALRMLSDYLVANPEVGLTYANMELVDDEGLPLNNSEYRRANQHPTRRSVLYLPLSGSTLSRFPDNYIGACFLYRRHLRDALGGYADNCAGFEDYDYWLRLRTYATVSHLDDDAVLYHYRLHQNSLTGTLAEGQLVNNTKLVQSGAECFDEILENPAKLRVIVETPEENPESELIAEGLSENRVNVTKQAGDRLKITLERDGNSASVIVRKLSPIPEYRHIAHRLLHAKYQLSPFVAVREGEAREQSSPAGTLLLPPLILPALLRAARAGFSFAVTPHVNSACTALIFAPDSRETGGNVWVEDRLLQLIGGLKRITFVLLCQTEREREFADRLNTKLQMNDNYRIIDLTREASRLIAREALVGNEEATDTWHASLGNVLGSVDLILSIKNQAFTLNSLLELRAEAALAACAGIGVVALTEHPHTEQCSSPEAWLESDRAVEAAISAYVLPLPHLAMVNFEQLREISELEEQLCRIATSGTATSEGGISIRSLEQWSSELSPRFFGGRLLRLLLNPATDFRCFI